METFYSPGADYQNFDLGEMMSWKSRAMTGSQFTTQPPEEDELTLEIFLNKAATAVAIP